jgi:hypothetical protein
VKFLESIDTSAVPFVTLAALRQGNQLVVAFDSVAGVEYSIQAKASLNSPWSTIVQSLIGTGQRMSVPVPINQAAQFVRLIDTP